MTDHIFSLRRLTWRTGDKGMDGITCPSASFGLSRISGATSQLRCTLKLVYLFKREAGFVAQSQSSNPTTLMYSASGQMKALYEMVTKCETPDQSEGRTNET
jgi:hypothetical protein